MSKQLDEDWGIEDSETIHDVMLAGGFLPVEDEIMNQDISDGFRAIVGKDKFQLYTPGGNPYIKHRPTCIFYISSKELGWICRCLSEDINVVAEYCKNLMELEGLSNDNDRGKTLGVFRFARPIDELISIDCAPLSNYLRPYLQFGFKEDKNQLPRLAWDFRGENAVHRLQEVVAFLQKMISKFKLPLQIDHVTSGTT